jgi:uncharacterized repeat protein (TIGR03943 family)
VKRETENTLLLLVGLSIGMIAVTGTFTRYVKPALLPWLAITAVGLIALALMAIVVDIRRGGPAGEFTDDGHSHRTAVVWLLVVPVVVLIFVAPPALRPQAATPTGTTASRNVPHRPFPPLPEGRAPEISLPEVLTRSVQDTSGTLTNRLITVTGFVLNESGGVDLARIVIICCAADAQLARIHLRGGDFHFTDNTWLRVEGEVTPAPREPHTAPIPTLHVVTVTPVAAPANQYA